MNTVTLKIGFSSGATAQRRSRPPRLWGFYITQNDTTQSVGLLWTTDRPAAETSTWQHATLTWDWHLCHRRDSNHNPSKRSAAEPRIRPLGHLQPVSYVLIQQKLSVTAVWSGQESQCTTLPCELLWSEVPSTEHLSLSDHDRDSCNCIPVSNCKLQLFFREKEGLSCVCLYSYYL
jgi:hypothetical protein